jgi:hypothetical protein
VFLAKGTRDGHSIDELLDLAGVTYRSSSDLSEFPKDQLDAVISQCRAVVAYVGSARPATGVVLEIGAGLGRGLPVVVILGPRVRASSLSPALRELPSMRLPAKVSQAAADRLRALLVTTTETPSGVLTTSQVGATGREHWVDEHERRVATILQRLGAVIVGYEPANRRGKPNLAAWIPDLPGVPFNPVLVEVAGRMPQVKEKERQLRGYMGGADALMGILVLPGDRRPDWSIQTSGAVLIVGVEALDEKDRSDFIRTLRDGRNRLFHAP